MGEGAMQFIDRFLKCADCGQDFIFTAGEQLFFYDKQFKNDPKRCKLCKAKRAGLGRSGSVTAMTELPLSRTETRTQCSACGVETTVPFKPTQGRPVLCRSCFQMKRVPATGPAVAAMDSPGNQITTDGVVMESVPTSMSFLTETSVTTMSGSDDSMVTADLMAAASEASRA
jgi:CxxC-x17-CxxC domain-containing protein